MRPSILILDEPTAGLDPAGEAQMMQLLKKLNREEGLTIILATHSVDMLPLFADRIYVLDGGRVLREGPAEEIFCHQEMIVRVKLRLPYVSRLMYEMKRHDGVPIDGLPLTIGEARAQLLELIPKELIVAGIEEHETVSALPHRIHDRELRRGGGEGGGPAPRGGPGRGARGDPPPRRDEDRLPLAYSRLRPAARRRPSSRTRATTPT